MRRFGFPDQSILSTRSILILNTGSVAMMMSFFNCPSSFCGDASPPANFHGNRINLFLSEPALRQCRENIQQGFCLDIERQEFAIRVPQEVLSSSKDPGNCGPSCPHGHRFSN